MSVQQSHTGPLSLISCVSARETSPVDDICENRNETKKKRFHPLRNLRRMFRRKSRQSDGDITDAAVNDVPNSRVIDPRSSSTGRLVDDDTCQSRRRSGSLAPGLSLSHDSVFKPERTDSGHSSSDLENSSLSIPILIPSARLQAELADVIRRRARDDSDDEDLGLPRSRCSSLLTDYPDKLPDRGVKSQSSCSEGSLLSTGTGSSLEDDLQTIGEGSDLDLKVTRHKLSHSAAKHKMAVRPRRNHGAGNKRHIPKSGSSLPATPEVNEETTMSWSAVVGASSLPVTVAAESSSSEPVVVTASVKVDSNKVLIGMKTLPLLSHSISTEPKSLLSSPPSPHRPETWSKSASLPHGAALSAESKVARSLSNATEKATETTLPSLKKREESRTDSNLKEESKPLSRKSSGKGNKPDLPKPPSPVKKEEIQIVDSPPLAGSKSLSRIPSKKEKSDVEIESSKSSETKSLSRAPDRRQRVEPVDIPCAPVTMSRMRISYSTSPPAPTWPAALAPTMHSTSPPKVVWPEIRNDNSQSQERTSLFIKNESRVRRDSRESKPPIKKSHSFHKDVPTPVYNRSSLPQNFADEDSNKRIYLKNRSSTKSVRKEEKDSLNAKLTKKSTSLESMGSIADQTYVSLPSSLQPKSLKSASSDSVRNVIVTHEEPQYANLSNLRLENFDHVHHGYENIEIIELVKKERATENNKTNKNVEVVQKEKLPEPQKSPPTFVEIKEVIEMPKVEKSLPVPEFMRVQLKDPKTGTLVERRKSELQSANEFEADKITVRTFKKQQSLVEIGSPQKEDTRLKKQISVQEVVMTNEVDLKTKSNLFAKPSDNVVIVEKPAGPQDEVTLRRKSQSTEGDEPELMKVFARRSLKVKDDDKDGDDSEGSRSRDSDKENDAVEPQPVKEERRKSDEQLVVLKPVAPLKPSIAARNMALNKFSRKDNDGKSLAEMKNKLNGSEKPIVIVTDKPSTLKKQAEVRVASVTIKDLAKEIKNDQNIEADNKKVDKDMVLLDKVIESPKIFPEKSEAGEEIGFKRIQERKAEWEKRLQAAKN